MFTHYVLYFKKLTLGANDGSRTHDLPITNRLGAKLTPTLTQDGSIPI
jgi:hypothetical protein